MKIMCGFFCVYMPFIVETDKFYATLKIYAVTEKKSSNYKYIMNSQGKE